MEVDEPYGSISIDGMRYSTEADAHVFSVYHPSNKSNTLTLEAPNAEEAKKV